MDQRGNTSLCAIYLKLKVDMFVLVVYDVSTKDKEGARRLRRVAKTCEDYGIRVQNSVFECLINLTHWTEFKNLLLSEVNLEEDSLRFYFLDEDNHRRTEHHGCKEPLDTSDTLLF